MIDESAKILASGRPTDYRSPLIEAILKDSSQLEKFLTLMLNRHVFSERECKAVIGEAKNLINRVGGQKRYESLLKFFNAVDPTR